MDIGKLYINHIEKSIQNAENCTSKINHEILNLEGMSGKKTRHFYNNILDLPDARYLEVGTWKGSSVCSAMFNNNANVVCIDDWSQFNGPKNDFLANLNKFKQNNTVKYIENNCFKIDVNTLPKFNIYLYDGDHSYESHKKAVTHFINCLDDICIFMVDDWNWQDVRNGTFDGIKATGLDVVYLREIRTTFNNEHPRREIGLETWWNGIGIMVLQKSH